MCALWVALQAVASWGMRRAVHAGTFLQSAPDLQLLCVLRMHLLHAEISLTASTWLFHVLEHYGIAADTNTVTFFWQTNPSSFVCDSQLQDTGCHVGGLRLCPAWKLTVLTTL